MHFIRYIRDDVQRIVLYFVRKYRFNLERKTFDRSRASSKYSIFRSPKKDIFLFSSRFSACQELLFPNKILFAELDIIKSIKEGNSIFGEIWNPRNGREIFRNENFPISNVQGLKNRDLKNEE